MRYACMLFVCLALALPSTGQAPAEPQYEGSLSVPSYAGGYILDWDSPTYTQITIYGLDAKAAYSKPLRSAEGQFYDVWAVDSDGVAARAYTWRENRNSYGAIDLLASDGKSVATIKTGSYFPQHLAFAPDHTLWTVGYEDDYERRAEDFNVVHHYARSGEEIGQGLPWLQIAGDYNAYTSLQLCLGGKQFFAANDRLGFRSHLRHGRGSWIEVSPGGNLIGKYDLGRYRELYYEPDAMTASGAVYAEILKEDHFDGWAVLDRSQGIWRKVHGYPKGRIIGMDGDNIIFSQHDGGWTILHSVSSAALRVDPPLKQELSAAALHE